MKFYLDKPQNIWADDNGSLAEHRTAYLKLIEAILAENCEFTVFERRPFIEEAVPEGCADGIYYAYHAALPGKNSYCFKRGPFPYLWYMDAGGYSGWSAVAREADLRTQAAQFPLERAVQVVGHYQQLMLQENVSILPQPKTIPEPDIAVLKDFVFCPLQVNNDEVMKLANVPQFEIIREAARVAHTLEQHIVFKRHPLCASPIIAEILEEEVGASPYVHLSVGSVNNLLALARTVLVTNSTVGLQALVLGKPVFSFGKSEYSHMTTCLTTSQGLHEVFQHTNMSQSEQVLRQLGYLLDEYFVDMRDMEKIRNRIRQHRDIFESGPKAIGAPVNIENYRVFLTLAHRLEKESRERLEFLLAGYARLSKAEKPVIVQNLSLLAYHGHHTNYIIRHSDNAVLNRALKLAQTKGNMASQERLLRAWVTEKPHNFQSLYQLSKVLYAQKDEQGGLKYAGLAAQQDKASVSAILFYVRKLLKDRAPNDTEILHYAQQVTAQAPQNSWVQWLQARIALFEGRIATADISIQAALDQEPATPAFINLRSEVTLAQEKLAELERLAEAEKLAELERLAEAEKLAELERLAEAEKLAELEKLAETERLAKAEDKSAAPTGGIETQDEAH